ncbi:PQQ-binding-like beta-propeller repeat protein [Deinococcus planocerae]|uniref:outer membrane protein assembly factor BamB family protein n=1 Tax=Deinococcus planocerae TaxID=1737569 RepID=UPI000C7ECD5A|nr:PQQ-binding-like beta-propeller repeat protein [Deinococcus planocerae]
MTLSRLLRCCVLLAAACLGAGLAQPIRAPTSAVGPAFLPTFPPRPVLWRTLIDPPLSPVTTTLAVEGERLFLLHRGRLRALDAASGAVRWEAGTGLLAPLTVHSGVAYTTGADGLRAFRASDGRSLWTTALRPNATREDGGAWAQNIARVGGTVVVNTTSGAWGVDASTGRQLWHRPRYDATGPVASAGDLGVWIAPDYFHPQVLGVDLRSGRTVWRVDFSDGTAVRVEDDTLFVGSSRVGVRLIDVPTGRSLRVTYDFASALPQGSRAGASFLTPLVSRNAVCASGQSVGRPVVACLPRTAGRRVGGDRALLPRLAGRASRSADVPQYLVREGFLTAAGDYWLLGGEYATRTAIRGGGLTFGAPTDFVEREGLAFYAVPEALTVVGVRLDTGALAWSAPLPSKWRDVLLTPTRILVVNGGEVQGYARPETAQK